jgi:hypothetical protein
MKQSFTSKPVVPGLVPGIHVLAAFKAREAWMAETSPAMTKRENCLQEIG